MVTLECKVTAFGVRLGLRSSMFGLHFSTFLFHFPQLCLIAPPPSSIAVTPIFIISIGCNLPCLSKFLGDHPSNRSFLHPVRSPLISPWVLFLPPLLSLFERNPIRFRRLKPYPLTRTPHSYRPVFINLASLFSASFCPPSLLLCKTIYGGFKRVLCTAYLWVT